MKLLDMKLPEREPMWEQAMKVMATEGDLGPTMRRSLPMEHLVDMIFAKGVHGQEVSIYDIFTDLSIWINNDDNMPHYLSRYFHDGAEVMLAYVMAIQYGLFWGGDVGVNAGKWVTPE